MKNDHPHSHAKKPEPSCCGGQPAGETAHATPPASRASLGEGQRLSEFLVDGMDCADEVQAIRKVLAVDGIASVDVNLMTSKVSVVHGADVSTEELTALINTAGVRVRNEETKGDQFSLLSRRVLLVAVSGLLCGIGLLGEYLGFPYEVVTGVYIVSVLVGGLLVFPKALRSLRNGSLDMNVLMTVAVVGAFFIGSHSEAAAVIFFFALAELLESFSVQRARHAISEVLKFDVDEAYVVTDGGSIAAVPSRTVSVGQVVRVLAGQRIPLDGQVREGEASVSEAALTGESMPVQKTKGDRVLAGSVCENGTIDIEVTRAFSDSKLSQMIRMVEDAQSRKSPAQRFVDRFARIYTPTVFVVAILIALAPLVLSDASWSAWIYRALVLLVIACPCALVISTPVAIVSGLTGLARRGVLVKGGVHLETLGRIKAVAIDKTGTLTEGRPKVIRFDVDPRSSEKELFEIAASLESQSTHPLARAIVAAAASKGFSPLSVTDLKTLVGRGLQGIVAGHPCFLGNHKLVHELGLCDSALEARLSEAEARGHSVVIVGHEQHDGCQGKVLGVFELGDALREDSVEALKALHHIGIRHIAVLSGDNQRTVSAIAKSVSVDSAIGDLMPEGKVEKIQLLKREYGYVGMVGDGINDAPAMAAADLGISMGASGTDVAIETSDVALMKDDLGVLSVAVSQARKALRTIQANIAFALATKAVFLVLLAFGISSMWLAIAADMGASLLVIANALCLIKAPKQSKSEI